MVSPFMSFATGALQAVNQNIDRYRANKAAEEEREDAAAQRMKELQFQRDTSYEVEKRRQESAYNIEELKQKGIDAKKQITIGGFSYLRDAKNPDLEARNFLSAAETNPEAFKAAYNDARYKPIIESHANRIFATIRRGDGIYSQKDKFGRNFGGRVPNNHVPSQLRQIDRIKNSLILQLADKFNSNTAEMRGNPGENTPAAPNAVYSKLEDGIVRDFNLDGVKGLDNALRAFKGVNLGYDRMNDTSLKSFFSKP